MRRALLALLAVLLVAPAPALGAALTLDAGVATYTAGDGDDRVEVRYDPAAGTIAFAEPLSALTVAPAGCTAMPGAVETVIACPASAIAAVVVHAGGGADEVRVTAPVAPAATLEIQLGAGDDRLDAAGAAWSLLAEGGDGSDTLTGGELADTLRGGAGADMLDGRGGADALQGGPGQDVVSYRSRTERVVVTLGGGPVADDGEAGEGDAVAADVEGVLGGAGDDLLVGTRRADTLDGGGGSDLLRGLGGADLLLGDGPVDPVTGASLDPEMIGDDVLEGGLGADTMHGGSGVDTVSYLERLKRVRVDLTSRAALQGEARERDLITGVENVWGGLGHDTLLGDAGPNVLWGGPGRDVVHGRGGADVVAGGPGRDTLRGDAGDDVIAAREGARDIIACGAGRDRVAIDDGDVDVVRRDCERRDVYAGGGVGGAPLGAAANPDAKIDPSRPYVQIAARRLAPAADGTLPVPLVCSARAAARCSGTLVLRQGTRVVGRADIVVAAGRDATLPVALDPGVVAAAQRRAVRLAAVIEVTDVVRRAATFRTTVDVRAAAAARRR